MELKRIIVGKTKDSNMSLGRVLIGDDGEGNCVWECLSEAYNRIHYAEINAGKKDFESTPNDFKSRWQEYQRSYNEKFNANDPITEDVYYGQLDKLADYMSSFFSVTSTNFDQDIDDSLNRSRAGSDRLAIGIIRGGNNQWHAVLIDGKTIDNEYTYYDPSDPDRKHTLSKGQLHGNVGVSRHE